MQIKAALIGLHRTSPGSAHSKGRHDSSPTRETRSQLNRTTKKIIGAETRKLTQRTTFPRLITEPTPNPEQATIAEGKEGELKNQTLKEKNEMASIPQTESEGKRDTVEAKEQTVKDTENPSTFINPQATQKRHESTEENKRDEGCEETDSWATVIKQNGKSKPLAPNPTNTPQGTATEDTEMALQAGLAIPR